MEKYSLSLSLLIVSCALERCLMSNIALLILTKAKVEGQRQWR